VLARQVEQGRVAVPDDEQVASLYGRAIERLAQAGLAQYEISNFARRRSSACTTSVTGVVRNTSASGWPPIHLPLGGDSRTAGTSMGISTARTSGDRRDSRRG